MNPFAALEKWAIILVVAMLAGGGMYFKGRHDEASIIHTQQLAADAAELQKANTAIIKRGELDTAAADRTKQFLDLVDGGIRRVQTQFAGLPAVIVDTHGCSQLSPAFFLRYNATTASLLGTSGQPADKQDGAVPAGAVPPAR